MAQISVLNTEYLPVVVQSHGNVRLGLRDVSAADSVFVIISSVTTSSTALWAQTRTTTSAVSRLNIFIYKSKPKTVSYDCIQTTDATLYFSSVV